METCAESFGLREKRFAARDFTFLVRFVCHEVEPAGELMRAFETFDQGGHNAASQHGRIGPSGRVLSSCACPSRGPAPQARGCSVSCTPTRLGAAEVSGANATAIRNLIGGCGRRAVPQVGRFRLPLRLAVQVSADALVAHLTRSGVPPEEIESIIRAAGTTACVQMASALG